MTDLPRLTAATTCPDEDCRVPIGRKHTRECSVAICIMTGCQRVLHSAAPPGRLIPAPGFDEHVCGEDVWSGYPHGAVEAAAAGLFVRERRPGDPGRRRWIPCEPSHPDATPDLDRVIRAGYWNPVRQVWEIPTAVTCRG